MPRRPLPPPIADFEIPGLGLTFRDARRCSEADQVEAGDMLMGVGRRMLADDRPGSDVFVCADDEANVSERLYQASIKAQLEGRPATFGDIEESGEALLDEVSPDPRIPDLAFLLYADRPRRIVGSFVMVRLRWRADGRAQAIPFPAILGWQRKRVSVLWAEIMNWILDNPLTYQDGEGALDVVEWRFIIDRPDASYFRHNVVDPHGVNGLRAAVTGGRDVEGEDTAIRTIRRSGEVYVDE